MPRPTPNWAPAEAHIPDLLPELMWMGTVVHGGTQIEQYKHIVLRSYINLDASGQAWRIRVPVSGGSTYDRIDLASARLAVGG